MYVTPEKTYDFKRLASVTKVIVKNLNKIIDINYYPVPEVPLPFSFGHHDDACVRRSTLFSTLLG